MEKFISNMRIYVYNRKYPINFSNSVALECQIQQFTYLNTKEFMLAILDIASLFEN